MDVVNLQVINRIAECSDRTVRRRDLSAVSRIIVHRIDGLGESAIEICDRFQTDPDVAKYTGGENPYHFFILRSGQVEQACPLVEMTYHARRFNLAGIGVACIGDFRKHEPPQEQWRSLVDLCAVLRIWRELVIVGHTELGSSATSDPAKECPGRYLPISGLIQDVQVVERLTRERSVVDCGIIF